jgi:hypothetical protein
MAKVNTVFDRVVNVSFEANIIKAFEGEKKSTDKFRVMQDKAIQQMLDAFVVACDKPKAVFTKGNAATNPALAQVRAVFMLLAGQRKDDAGNWVKVDAKNKPLPVFISESSANSYGSAFWYAFEHNVPFQRDLNNRKSTGRKDAGEGEGEGEGEAKTTTAKSKVITLDEAQRSFSIALAQLRAVNQADLAGDLLDVMLERYPDFKETTVK